MKSTQLYDFTLAAGGSQVILADANFYKILTATGDLKITRDGGSTVRPMRAGRGEREVEFKSLIVTDISGAPNSGTIVVGDSNFIDDTIVLSSAINVRPEAPTANYKSNSIIAANTADAVFAAASNTGGAIVLSAALTVAAAGPITAGFIAKATAPATPIDGDPVFLAGPTTASANITTANLPMSQYVPAGLGLYFISDTLTIANYSLRACRYKLL